MEVNVINRVTVQRLVARVATDEIPPGGYSDGWRGFLSEPASDAPAESVLAGRARLQVAVAGSCIVDDYVSGYSAAVRRASRDRRSRHSLASDGGGGTSAAPSEAAAPARLASLLLLLLLLGPSASRLIEYLRLVLEAPARKRRRRQQLACAVRGGGSRA